MLFYGGDSGFDVDYETLGACRGRSTTRKNTAKNINANDDFVDADETGGAVAA